MGFINNPSTINTTVIGNALYPTLSTETGVVANQYPYGDLRRFGGDPTGAADSSAAMANALLSGDTIYGAPDIAATFKFNTLTGFDFFGKRFIGAGSNATVLEFPLCTGYCLTFGGTDTAAPGGSGFLVQGSANAAGGITLQQPAVGCRRGLWQDVIVLGITKAGAYAWDLVGNLGNGIYYNTFINCAGGGASAGANAHGWRVYSSDGAANGNRCNGNQWFGGGATFNSGDGFFLQYASSNTFVGCDREQNGGWGFNISDDCFGVTIIGGDDENNTNGSVTKDATCDVHVLGGNVADAPGGVWNANDHWMPGGAQAGKFGVDDQGNLTFAGTIVNMTGANPFFQAQGTNLVSFDTTNFLWQFFRGFKINSQAQTPGSAALVIPTQYSCDEILVNLNNTSVAMPAGVDGWVIQIKLKQGAGGPYTFSANNAAWSAGANVRLIGGAYAITATVGKIDILTFQFRQSENAWLEINGRAQNL